MFFGSKDGSNYRLLDARDGWNYLATASPARRKDDRMTKLREIFDRDPGTGRRANNGQARIIQSPDADELAVLRHEIEDFVCEGAFKDSIGAFSPSS